MFDPVLLIDYVDRFSYAGIFVISLLSGHLIPFPEDVILLVSGYLASAGFINPYITILVSMAGIVIGDTILYSLSKSDSRYIHRFREYVRRSWLVKREAGIRKHIRLVIFVARFIPFVRSIGPVIAGIVQVPRKTFQWYNFLGLVVYVPLVVGIGYFFQSGLSTLFEKVDSFQHTAFVGLMMLIGLVGAIVGNRKIDRFLKK